MASQSIAIPTATHQLRVEGDLKGFTATCSSSRLEEGLYLVAVRLSRHEPSVPPSFKVAFEHPDRDVQALWHPAAGRNKGVPPNWASNFTSRATQWAPVVCFHNLAGLNRITFACSEARNLVAVRGGVEEETALLRISMAFFEGVFPPLQSYEVKFLIDSREQPYYEVLKGVGEWWATMPGMAPSPVPEAARLPMYSTWYSFHQSVSPEPIEEQCRLSKALGCASVIVDDGWQTSDNNRGYAYCGDWEVSPQRIPDMAAHVGHVHDLGMKYLLWYSVPFVGVHSKAYQRFQGKFLHHNQGLSAAVLDPRFPEVREYLIGVYEKAVREWDLDGFKLDFVDNFHLGQDQGHTDRRPVRVSGMDLEDVDEAADRLLTDVMARLRAIKPGIMVEFRQAYIGPLMRKYGNMFRAGDCPNDSLENRVRTLDLRLLCGGTAVHSDMVMWHYGEPVESAALQLLNILFSVPQISVKLDKIPADHLSMIKFWLGFWREHRDVLLDGELAPRHPETLFPLVTATTAGKTVAAVYDDVVADLDGVPGNLFVVNGKRSANVVLRLGKDLGDRNLTIYSCTGVKVSEKKLVLESGLHELAVPPAGLVKIQE